MRHSHSRRSSGIHLALRTVSKYQIRFSARKYFMDIGLVSHIPYDLILREIHYTVKCHGYLHTSKIGRKMTACMAYLSIRNSRISCARGLSSLRLSCFMSFGLFILSSNFIITYLFLDIRDNISSLRNLFSYDRLSRSSTACSDIFFTSSAALSSPCIVT